MKDAQGVMSVAVIAAGITALYFMWRFNRDKSKWKAVATVDKLFVYPVKSFRGISVNSFTCHEDGAMLNNGSDIGDRTFMAINAHGRFATLRQFPKMVLIEQTVIGSDRLRLVAPGMKPLEIGIPSHGSGKVFNYRVFGFNCPGVDCGDEAATWLQEYLGDSTFRLVFHNKQLPPGERTTLLEFGHLGVYAEKPMKSIFHDLSPFNILSQRSLDWLNSKLDLQHKVTARNFRPNIFLRGCHAFAEDEWKRIRIGTAEFVFAKHCSRCVATTINPSTGIKDPDRSPLTTLTELRQCQPCEKALYESSPIFSDDYVNVKPGKISVGDKVYLCVSG